MLWVYVPLVNLREIKMYRNGLKINLKDQLILCAECIVVLLLIIAVLILEK